MSRESGKKKKQDITIYYWTILDSAKYKTKVTSILGYNIATVTMFAHSPPLSTARNHGGDDVDSHQKDPSASAISCPILKSTDNRK